MPSPAKTAQSLIPHLRSCGYGEAQLAIAFKLDKTVVPVVGFAGRPWDNWSACVAVVDLQDDSKASAHKIQSLGASSVFVCGEEGIDWWAMGANGPTRSRQVSWSDAPKVFREYKSDLAPSRIYNAKLRKPTGQSRQLWFFDAGLMPAVERKRGDTLLRLVENAIEGLISKLGPRLKSRQAQEDAYRTVFWLLAAKILHDKRVPNFRQIDLTNVDQVFERIGRHHGETNRYPPFGRSGRHAIQDVAAGLAECGSLADVTSESIAYVYENAMIDKTAGNRRHHKGDNEYDIRKELGIHSTPSVLIHHILSQLWPLIERIAPDDRHVFEPACGHAPFLTATMRWLREWDENGDAKQAPRYMRSHLHGLDAESFALELAKLNLTLADEPHGNSWSLEQNDMFMPGVLAQYASQARILLANPPYESFSPSQREMYQREGEKTTATTKAVEMLARTLPYLQPGSVIGVVLPQGMLKNKKSRPVRKLLLSDFDLTDISLFADNLFEHGDHEVAVIIGRKRSRQAKATTLHYRRVRECHMEAFKERLNFSWEREVPQSRFLASGDASMWLPELDEVWAFMAAERGTLGDVAEVNQGLFHRGAATLGSDTWTIHDPPQRGDVLGFANVPNDLRIFETPNKVGINLSEETIDRLVAGAPSHKPQVLLNYASLSRKPWKLKATLDEEGLAVTNRFSAIRPLPDCPSALCLWAILNSPVANAFAYCHLGKRDVLVGTMRKMPIPGISPAHVSRIEQASLRYRQIATSPGPLFTGASYPDAVKQALLEMDAAVLSAYDIPPYLERQLLDLFTGVPRKGVGCEFRGYYPPGYTSYLPLHLLLSERFQHAAADQTAARWCPDESAYIRKVLSSAAAAKGEQ